MYAYMTLFTRIFTEKVTSETSKINPRIDVVKVADLNPKADKTNIEKELGGYDGPEPTRFGDWEHKGRCTDF